MRWWTSDLHFGHRNIVQLCDRPFADSDEMDAALVDRWNDHVSGDDEVWVVGDWSLCRITYALEIVAALNGKITIIAGNHDPFWAGHSKGVARATERFLEAGIARIEQGPVSTTIGGVPVTVSHFPYRDHNPTGRYPEQHPEVRSAPLIHGHVHELWKTAGWQINVGVDVWDFCPVPEPTVAAFVAAMPHPPL